MNRFVTTLIVLGALVAPRHAQAAADHSLCFKIKDGLAPSTYRADLVPADGTFPVAAGCTVKLPAKMMCLDVAATNVTPEPPGAAAGEPAQKSLCYRVVCPAPATAIDVAESDQFGSRRVVLRKAGLVCAPISGPATTTTSTTTTTITLPEFPCTSLDDCPAVPNGEKGCVGGGCRIVACDPGYVDCDGDLETGCEVDTSSDVNNCGGCGAVCDLDNAVAVCTAGECEIERCNPITMSEVWANCNGDPADGCEENTNNNNDACGPACEVCSTFCSEGVCVP